MHKKIRWGILGCGRIARKFAGDLKWVDNGVLTAIASRNPATAQAFAAEFPVPHVHDSYEDLVSNPEVDVVYVATPHALHYENTLLCLDHGKAVLCEKAFAINTRQASAMIQRARSAGVFLMEALWTRFLPHYQLARTWAEEGKLGNIRSVLVNFGFRPAAPAPARLLDPSLGGGTMLDIGIYNVFIALSFLGKPDTIEASAALTPDGVDEQCAVLFRYRNGAMAQLFSTFQSNLPTEAEICGDAGRIRLTTRFYEPTAKVEYYPGYPDSCQVLPVAKEAGLGYQFEARHVGWCLLQGLTESPVMAHADTLLLMETLDAIRSCAGIRYPADA
jgi:predicted dehydrogenase